jgi:indolepyruvate ferredoxin oxidoreductase
LPDGVEVHHRDRIVEVQEELRSTPGVTVLIHDQFCAAELRRSRKRGTLRMPTKRIVINHRVCEGCGDCGDVSNCLSVQPLDTPLGRKTTIDQASCNYDESCLEGDCPAFMTVEPGEASSGTAADAIDRLTADAGEVPDPAVDAARDLVRIRMAGIGGTGVVTVAQILSIAAMFDGWEVRGLDQTGLSQKAGPVISDVVLARSGRHSSNLVGDGQAHLLLGFDGLVAASDTAIRAASPDRTVTIASTHRTPTGRMITHPALPYPDDSIERRLDARSRPEANRFPDATALATALTGSSASANVFLLGVALQDGRVPISIASIERAIGLNGVAVDTNLAALDWGRRWAHDPGAVEALALTAPAAPDQPTLTVPDLPRALDDRVRAITDDDGLRRTIRPLAADLVGYQDVGYARRFLDAVTDAAVAERRAVPGSTRLTEGVARSLHKLMAYKDEYEVARLLLLPDTERAATAVGGPEAQITWHLHPPLLKALGMGSKIGMKAAWAKHAMRTLRAGKRVRGTRLDPFGRTEMRRIEAMLPAEFLSTMATVYAALDAERLDGAVAIAELPDMIRGYEDLKLRRVDEYRDRVAAALRGYAGEPAVVHPPTP